MSYFGTTSSTHVEIDCWLVISPGDPHSWPRRPNVKICAGYPNLARNQRALNLKIEMPLSIFEAPMLSAKIKVEDPGAPITIDCEALAEAVYAAIGMDVEIAVKPQASGEGEAA